MMRAARGGSTIRGAWPAASGRQSRALPSAIIALVLAVTGCGSPATRGDTVVIASGADLESANPLVTIHPIAKQLQRYALFVTLARWDSTLTPRPYFARGWTAGDGGRTLTFHLVPGLAWDDGVPTTAADAAFTLDAARDPATGYPSAAALQPVTAVRAIDDTTLEVRFAVPQPVLPDVFCELAIVPRHLLDRVPRAQMRRAAFNLAPVGNGPFQFVSRRPGQRWVFARNDRFPEALGGPPDIARLVIAVVDEASTKFAALVSGEVDLAGIAPSMAALAARDPALRVVSYPALFSTGLAFNTTRPPFDDARVRRAVALFVRRGRIIDAALSGYATPAAGAVPPDHPFALPPESLAVDAPRSADDSVRAADALLDAAGWRRGTDGARTRGGVSFAVELLTVGSGDNAVEQLIQSDFADRGLRLSIRQMELGAFLTAARATGAGKRFDLLLTGVPGDLSLAYLSAMYESRAAGGALDYSGYHDAGLDTLFARTRSAPTIVGRAAAWRAVQRALDRAMPAVWLYHGRGVQGVSRRLSGVRLDLRGELPTLARWHILAAPAPGLAAARP
jgi:peptide/nickel transport system substrate-binding protein